MKRFKWTALFLLIFLAACVPQTEIIPGDDPHSEVPQSVMSQTASPAGLRVVYSKNADPWIWTEGEGPRQLADSVNVMEMVISSDGQVVAFKRDDSGELFAVNADGSNLHPLVSAEFLAGENATVWAFDFAPHSHNIYFTLNVAGGAFEPRYDLQRVDTDTAGPNPSTVFGPGQGGIANFSPDGQWMTLYHPGGLDLARVDGSEARTVFSYPEGYEPATFGPEIVWMEDSSGFSIFHTPDPLGNPSLGGLWFVPENGEPVEKAAIDSTWGIPSPDGQRVGFNTNSNPAETHIVEANGIDTVYRTTENANFIGWAPDSEHFLVIVEEEENGRVSFRPYLCRLGEEPVLLTDTSAADPVVWITEDMFLFASWGEIRLQRTGEASLLLDQQVYNVFDFTILTP